MVYDQQLLPIYQQYPCRTLPNAFWKTAVQMEYAQMDISTSPGGELSALMIRHDNNLLAFWCRHPGDNPLNTQQVEKVQFALVHQNGLPVFDGNDFSRRQAFFRLRHTASPPSFYCPTAFMYQDFSPAEDVAQAVDFIKACYRDINVSKSIIGSWFDHPVYAPELWVWVIDKVTGKKAALGIAELDQRVPEASLEWIQVLPAYQRKGLGKALVAELLRRVSGRVAFSTVSGEVDNISQPERLYRACGFEGSDIWWLLAV